MYRRYSNETAPIEIPDDIYRAAGSQDAVILSELDISTAFHTLEYRFGFTGDALQWIKSYVSERSQTVAVEQSRCDFDVHQ